MIAGLFWGHTHEDEFMIYYSENGTVQDAAHAQAIGWVGPSVTPLTNLNSGFRMYTVDTNSFEVMDAYTFYADVNSFPGLNTNVQGPVFQFEYSTRDTYPVACGWPEDAPLNATYWHKVTEAMEANHTLVSIHNTYEGKSSVRSPNCTSDACAQAKICYMRSGSAALGLSCPPGYVQLCFDAVLVWDTPRAIRFHSCLLTCLPPASPPFRAPSLGRTFKERQRGCLLGSGSNLKSDESSISKCLPPVIFDLGYSTCFVGPRWASQG